LISFARSDMKGNTRQAPRVSSLPGLLIENQY
jgi:hypothetical protein